MNYCGPRGIPYAEFLSWDELSQDAAIAWDQRDHDKCGGCGLPRSDMLDDDGVELRDQPFVPVDVYCPGCAAMAEHTNRGDDAKARPGVSTGFITAREADRRAAASRAKRSDARIMTP